MLEKEFAGTLAADTRDVNFYLGHIETQFRVFPKPLANLGEHLQGSFESSINVRVDDDRWILVESELIEGDILGGNADGIIRSGMSSWCGPLV